SQDTSDVADVTAFDKSLNKLDVNIQPNQVKLNVKLQEYSKKVKVKINKKGRLPDGASLDDITLDENEIEIYGNRDDLQDINEIEANVDLNNITESTDQNVQLKLPDKVKKSDPDEITAHISLK
ncbi:CdaR family protein, partial [Staphylococcus haemolyticus]